MFEHGFTKIRNSQETIVDPCEFLLVEFVSNYGPGDILSFLEFSHINGHEVFPF